MTPAITRLAVLGDGNRSPLQVTAGESTLVSMFMIDPASALGGALVPFDLTGCTVAVTFRAAAPNGTVQGDPVFSPAVAIAENAATGIASFLLRPVDTSTWTGMYTWDAWVTDGDGNRCVRVKASLVQVSESGTAPTLGD